MVKRIRLSPEASRRTIYALGAVFLLLVQHIPSSPLSALGFAPEFVTVVAVCVALWEGEYFGAVFGLCGGFAWDVLGGEAVGFNSLCLMATGYLAGFAASRFLRRTAPAAVVLAAGALVLRNALSVFFFRYIWGTAEMSAGNAAQILLRIGYSLLFALPIYYLSGLVAKRFGVGE